MLERPANNVETWLCVLWSWNGLINQMWLFSIAPSKEKNERKKHAEYICVRLSYKCLRIAAVYFWDLPIHRHRPLWYIIERRPGCSLPFFFLIRMDSISLWSVPSLLLWLNTEKEKGFFFSSYPCNLSRVAPVQWVFKPVRQHSWQQPRKVRGVTAQAWGWTTAGWFCRGLCVWNGRPSFKWGLTDWQVEKSFRTEGTSWQD